MLTAPRGGSTIRPLAVLCYELSGTSREPEVALEVALLQPGSTTVVRTASAQGMVGRQSAQVDLSGLPAGPYDLRVQMIVNGERLPGGNVTLRNVRVAADGPETVCA